MEANAKRGDSSRFLGRKISRVQKKGGDEKKKRVVIKVKESRT